MTMRGNRVPGSPSLAAGHGAILRLFKPTARDREDYRGVLALNHARMIEADAPYMRTLAAGEPLAAMLARKSSLVWAKAEVIYDSPEKGKVQGGEQGGRLLRHRLGEVANGAG